MIREFKVKYSDALRKEIDESSLFPLGVRSAVQFTNNLHGLVAHSRPRLGELSTLDQYFFLGRPEHHTLMSVLGGAHHVNCMIAGTTESSIRVHVQIYGMKSLVVMWIKLEFDQRGSLLSVRHKLREK